MLGVAVDPDLLLLLFHMHMTCLFGCARAQVRPYVERSEDSSAANGHISGYQPAFRGIWTPRGTPIRPTFRHQWTQWTPHSPMVASLQASSSIR